VELRDLEAYGEPGAVVYLADCVELMRLMPAGSVDVIFADPPYRLSTGGVTVRSSRLASVDKGGWDRSLGTSVGTTTNGCAATQFIMAGFSASVGSRVVVEPINRAVLCRILDTTFRERTSVLKNPSTSLRASFKGSKTPPLQCFGLDI
jgi:hypothetical protein